VELVIMRPSLRAITFSAAIISGGGMLLVGIVNMAVPSYGAEFLRMMSSVYPGADTAPTIWRVLLGTLYGCVDGAVAGALFGLLYRAFDHHPAAVTAAK
jgi:hypothetical protein